jgi:hypothetical protein
MSGPVGLSYPGVEAAARMMQITITPDLFAAIRICEREWLNVISERRK